VNEAVTKAMMPIEAEAVGLDSDGDAVEFGSHCGLSTARYQSIAGEKLQPGFSDDVGANRGSIIESHAIIKLKFWEEDGVCGVI
jgi:hypothetical protein